MVWQSEVEEIARRRAIARELGGAESVARHHAEGRLTIRERLELLLDPGSFRELGVLAGTTEYDDGRLTTMRPSNAVAGTGLIEGRPVVAGGEDYTIRGGSADGGGSAKLYYVEHLARQQRVPLVR